MASLFPNLNCFLAQISVVPEHGTECTRGGLCGGFISRKTQRLPGLAKLEAGVITISSLVCFQSMTVFTWVVESPSKSNHVFLVTFWLCWRYVTHSPPLMEPQTAFVFALVLSEPEQEQSSKKIQQTWMVRDVWDFSMQVWCKLVETNQQNISHENQAWDGLNTALPFSACLSGSVSFHRRQDEASSTPESWAFQPTFLLIATVEIRQANSK